MSTICATVEYCEATTNYNVNYILGSVAEKDIINVTINDNVINLLNLLFRFALFTNKTIGQIARCWMRSIQSTDDHDTSSYRFFIYSFHTFCRWWSENPKREKHGAKNQLMECRRKQLSNLPVKESNQSQFKGFRSLKMRPGVKTTVAWYRCTTPVLFCGHRRSPPLLIWKRTTMATLNKKALQKVSSDCGMGAHFTHYNLTKVRARIYNHMYNI